MQSKHDTLKYPKSMNNIQCIGPCYKAGTVIIHPSTLDEITSNVNFCPIDTTVIHDPTTGERSIEHISACYMPTTMQYDMNMI